LYVSEPGELRNVRKHRHARETDRRHALGKLDTIRRAENGNQIMPPSLGHDYLKTGGLNHLGREILGKSKWLGFRSQHRASKLASFLNFSLASGEQH
jgi:hypothetical protein